MWDDSVIAQMASERRGFAVLRGVWGQAFWSLIALVALAALALRHRDRAKDPPLLQSPRRARRSRMLATLASNTKDGTGLNVIVPVETVLVPLALAGAVFYGRRLVPALLIAFTLVQSLSLITTPRTATPFIFPTSERGAWGRAGSETDVDRELTLAAACPPASRTPARRSSPSSPTARCPTASPTSSSRCTHRTSPTSARRSIASSPAARSPGAP